MSTQILHDHLEAMLENTPANAYWKNKNGCYLGANSKLLQTAGFTKPEDIMGLTDCDLCWGKQGPLMMHNDKKIFVHQHENAFIEYGKNCLGSIEHYLSYKMPLHGRSGKIIGTFGLSYLINETKPLTTLPEEMGLFCNPFITNRINELQKKLNPKLAYGLTQRQYDCLYFLVRGMTAKEIGKKLGLSPKTVEHYLDNIKIKLNCQKRSNLIEKALQMGMFW